MFLQRAEGQPLTRLVLWGVFVCRRYMSQYMLKNDLFFWSFDILHTINYFVTTNTPKHFPQQCHEIFVTQSRFVRKALSSVMHVTSYVMPSSRRTSQVQSDEYYSETMIRLIELTYSRGVWVLSTTFFLSSCVSWLGEHTCNIRGYPRKKRCVMQ
jgi:hypothetical protein